ncbi:MAG TPA: peptidylprolyl isomerase, partial [Thermoguttaceae bacterium]|nr:peptidylprolyl isomerase [Thermoguttaceae bacterium]
VIAVMVQVLIGHLKADEYEEVLRKAQLLIENRAPEPGVYGLAGSAAFNLCDFDAAEKYFTLAKENDALGGMAEHFASQVADYKKFWQQEQQIRAAEARADDLPRVLLKTSQGEIELEMLENEAPIAVANFVSLVEKGYYDGLTFHRVIPNFMAQGGCPKGEGTGGPGYNIPCECYQPNFRRHFRGSLSMAHAGRDTGGSQFFLTFGPTSHLDERHTVFGRVVQGFEVLSKIQRRDPQQPDAPTPDRILEAKVLRKRDHQYVPTKVADEFNE